MVGPVNVKTIYAKCEKKKFGQLHDQSNGQFGQFGQFFFGIFGFRGVNISKERKCKMKQTTCGWIREIVGV